MIDEPGYMLGAERRRNLGLKANEELYDPKTNVRAAKSILDSRIRSLGRFTKVVLINSSYHQTKKKLWEICITMQRLPLPCLNRLRHLHRLKRKLP